MGRRFDLILFGATGFTGRHCVETIVKTLRVHQAADRPLFSWAVSGRNTDKLRQILDDVGGLLNASAQLADIECIEADVGDYGSICAMVRQCHVVLNTVGPFAQYGEVVIRACVRERTHHVDVNAEAHNLALMQLKHNEEAEENGVYIVGACGVDSIPVDCGMAWLQAQFPGELNSVEAYMYTGSQLWSQKINYGTWQSMIRFYSEFSKLRPLLNKLYPDAAAAPSSPQKLRHRGFHYNAIGERGPCAPFPAPDTWTVERTQLYNWEQYGRRPVQYTSYLQQSNWFLTLGLGLAACFLWFLTRCACGVRALERWPGFFSAGLVNRRGPSRAQMERFKFSYTLVGRGWKYDPGATDISEERRITEKPEETLVVKVDGVNPAYGVTNTCLLQAALTILEEEEKMPSTGGVFTPGTAFADTSLIERLNENGMTIKVWSDTNVINGAVATGHPDAVFV